MLGRNCVSSRGKSNHNFCLIIMPPYWSVFGKKGEILIIEAVKEQADGIEDILFKDTGEKPPGGGRHIKRSIACKNR